DHSGCLTARSRTWRMNTETIGPRHLGEILPNAIGRRPGATTAVAEPLRSSVVARLLEQSPEATDAGLLASLQQRCGLHADLVTSLRFPEAGGYHRAVDRVELQAGQG